MYFNCSKFVCLQKCCLHGLMSFHLATSSLRHFAIMQQFLSILWTLQIKKLKKTSYQVIQLELHNVALTFQCILVAQQRLEIANFYKFRKFSYTNWRLQVLRNATQTNQHENLLHRIDIVTAKSPLFERNQQSHKCSASFFSFSLEFHPFGPDRRNISALNHIS